MWSRIGGGKNACAGLPLRLVLKGEMFSPLYWKTKHQALIDMQRQCGFPALFKTMAPWEYSFPYHVFVLDEMEKGGRGRMQLAGLETLHTAHVFTELNRGLYSGLNKTAAQDGWKDHILASTASEEGNKTVVNYFQRLEFQDGKRKRSAWVPDAEEQPALRGYMLGRPHGRSDSGWPVEGGESRYDPEDKIVRVLFDYQPAEPEMWLYLCAQQMPPCRYGGTMVPLIAPWPGMEAPPQVVNAYEDSEWRREDMILLVDCRKTNKDGRIAQWVIKLHKAAGDVQPADDEATKLRKLHDLANSCAMSGEKLVACDMLSLFNDRWFGQWLALRQPFRCLDDLMLPEVREKVPPQYVHFANAVLQCPEFWQDEERIHADLELEAMGNVLAQRALVEKFLSGELAKEDTDGTREALREVGLLPEEEDPMFKDVHFNERQERLEKSICKLLDRAKAAREAPNEAAWDRIVEEAKKQNRSKHPEADVDTCAGAFFLYKDSVEVMDCLTQYDMIAVDEISQLSQKDFERIIQMWEAADRVPVLVFAGDFWQLPGVQPTKATDSPKWHMVHQIELHDMWRCKDETLRQKLVALRTAMPTKELLKRICLRHKAWSGHRKPTAWDIQQLYRKVPHTTVATCTKRRAAHVNDLSIWVLFTTQRNADNYDEKNNVIAGRPPKPLTMKVYKNLRVHLTRNVDKSSDFVNGMEATVKSYDPNSRCLHVLTKTGRNLAVYPITDWVEGCGYVTAYPVRPGYASTVHKLQGAELEHITVWLDIPFMRAAGYVALSRVQRDTDYLLGGIVTRRHFLPAM
ncbi:Pif1 [Symbiodinium sp. CCMP2456]|nr:Pif1 [Symbiodinium sp. CCMP2456]